jgi:Ca-activated chloride channel family protein
MKNRLSLAFVFCALALLFVSSAKAQQPKASPTPQPDVIDDDDVVRVTSNLVVVPVSVVDKNGQPIQGLKISDFKLTEEGRQQEITNIGDPDEVPLDIALLIDVSSSVDSRFDFEKQAASRFLKEVLKPRDRATIFVIDNKPRLEQTLGSADLAAEKLLGITPAKSYTAFYDTVTAAAHYLAKNTPSNHRRVIVVISDGDDTAKILELALSKNEDLFQGSKEEVLKALQKAQHQALIKAQSDAMKEVQKADASFYSINPSGQIMHLNVRAARSQAAMETIADTTGGTSFLPSTEEDLTKVFRQLTAELRGQYLLQYYSSDESPDGKYLRINVKLPDKPEFRVRSRIGYYRKNS